MIYYKPTRDPVDNSIIDSYLFKSYQSTIAGSTYSVYDDLIIPASPNFPPSTSIRYFCYLPGEPYYDNIVTGSATFVVHNIDTDTILSRVAYDATLTANTYKIFPSNSAQPSVIEFHVGTGSNSAGDVIAFGGRFVNIIINSSNMNQMDNGILNTITADFCMNVGYSNTISANYSMAIGSGIIISSTYSLANGLSVSATSAYGHAEGYGTKSCSSFSHAEGSACCSSGGYSHAEGVQTETLGKYSHAEGYGSITGSTALYSHAEGEGCYAKGIASHVEGYGSSATGNYSHAEGNLCKAEGNYSHAEGNESVAAAKYSHAEGYNTLANSTYAHSEGLLTEANGNYSHAEGAQTEANGQASHAEGVLSIANGNYSHAEGRSNVCYGESALIIGGYNKSTGAYSFTAGYYNDSTANYSALFGCYGYSTVDNSISMGGGEAGNLDTVLLMKTSIYGAASEGSGNCNHWYTAGADYGEFFEWEDKNIHNNDRVGFFVELINEDRIAISNNNNNVLGIISGISGVVGDANNLKWNKKGKKDKFGRSVTKIKEIFYPNSTIIKYQVSSVINEDFDKNKEYISRADRKEWDIVGLLGKLYVRDDGTCNINDYCKCSSNGIATLASSNDYPKWRVIDRSATDVIKIFFR